MSRLVQGLRHADIRYRFVTAMIHEDKLIKIVFVKSEDNYSDMFTKNVNGEVYGNHVDAFVLDRSAVDDEDDSNAGRVSEIRK